MRGLALVLCLGVASWGCQTAPQTVEVKVPIGIPCTIPDIPRPSLPVDSLTPDADIFVATRALWATVELLEGWAAQAEAAMGACR